MTTSCAEPASLTRELRKRVPKSLLEQTEADELMVVTDVYCHDDRQRSFALLDALRRDAVPDTAPASATD